MRVIAKSRLREYWKKREYRQTDQSLKAWHDEVINAEWESFHDVKGDFPNASLVGNGRVVFNIKGNEFRLIVKFEFKMNAVFILFFSTHKEYDAITASEA